MQHSQCRDCERRSESGVEFMGGGSDLGGRRGDREFSVLGWRFATLCWWEGVIWVFGGEIGNLVPWAGVLPHFVGGMD